jgi:2-polyprenyl-6-methoxyphenol hydroxylase-like FAD-dependent oxidoreductase
VNTAAGTRKHAIVVGGSLAGLLAARVLSDHFENVTLIERDHIADAPGPRKGVPQGRHAHGLLLKGELIMAQLFPDLVPSLKLDGAVPVDMGLDFRWHHFGVWKARFDSGVKGSLLTRPFLEWHVARRVRAIRNVAILNAAVTQPAVDAQGNRVIGVELQPAANSSRLLPADLVVDASGRGSQTPRWLESVGYARPAESVVKVNVMYASRLYRRPSKPTDWRGMFVIPRAPLKRMAAIFSVEENRWLVTLGGLFNDHPPTDESGYLKFAASLPVPDVQEAISTAEPLTPIVTHRFPSNLRRHYEQLSHFPEGLVVMGDAVCSFNPIYGQGMTVSALEAMELNAALKQMAVRSAGLTGLPRLFHSRIGKIVDVAWRLATSEDLRYAEAEGKRPPGTAFLQWYTGRIHERCSYDTDLCRRFYRVMHMLDAPESLFHPSVVARIVRAAAA